MCLQEFHLRKGFLEQISEGSVARWEQSQNKRVIVLFPFVLKNCSDENFDGFLKRVSDIFVYF